jgi:acetyl-CoA carboxylase alpha subunit
MIDSTQFQNTIHRFIELYGDRTEGIGDEIHGGLAWVEDAKFVLIGGGEPVVFQPPSWRRISRLFGLAEQLRKPILLWDILFQADIAGPDTTLLHRSAAQNSRLQLMKLPVPIIGVFDKFSPQPDFASIDAAVLLQGERTDTQPIASAAETSSVLVKVTADPSHLKSDILDLLAELSALPAEKLVAQRMDTIREAVGGTRLSG